MLALLSATAPAARVLASAGIRAWVLRLCVVPVSVFIPSQADKREEEAYGLRI